MPNSLTRCAFASLSEIKYRNPKQPSVLVGCQQLNRGGGEERSSRIEWKSGGGEKGVEGKGHQGDQDLWKVQIMT